MTNEMKLKINLDELKVERQETYCDSMDFSELDDYREDIAMLLEYVANQVRVGNNSGYSPSWEIVK